ncbi:MAG: hypothetical protein L6300_11845 [Syntrophaceae bacterium]|nr:hypothetical protein [Pseudomonadota bacterium]MCG2740910.1 hypothetical protein [Syntrophaceae bacterium]
MKEAVRKVRAGHLTDGRHAPCIFPVPPAFPGGGIPDRPHLRLIEWGQATERNGMTIRREVLDG